MKKRLLVSLDEEIVKYLTEKSLIKSKVINEVMLEWLKNRPTTF